MAAERVQVRFARETQRCPFCHEQVAVGASDWVACKQCLARHHAPCWGESGRCAACAGTTPLVANAGAAEALAERALETTLPPDRGALARAARRVAVAALTPLSLGVYPIVDAEVALDAHDRAGVTSSARIAPLLRIVLPTLVLVPSVLELVVNLGSWRLISGARLIEAPFHLVIAQLASWLTGRATASAAELHLERAYGAQLLAVLAFFAALHVFREVVRHRDGDALHAALARAGAGAEASLRSLGRAGRRWDKRRAVDFVLTLASLVPFLGLLVLPLAASRFRGALAIARGHEEAAPVPARSPAAK